MVRLFQTWTDAVVSPGGNDFAIHLYANDSECVRAFPMMQFINMTEKCFNTLEDSYTPMAGFEIKALSKMEIQQNWADLLSATSKIINHLQESPVFYLCEEFTEEIYCAHYRSDELELIATYHDSQLARIIEWNREENEFLPEKHISVNVGELYVYPEYRGSGLSQALLPFTKKVRSERVFVLCG